MRSQPSETVEGGARNAIVAAMIAADDNAIERVGRQVLGRAGATGHCMGTLLILSGILYTTIPVTSTSASGDVNVGYEALLTLIAVVAVARLAWLLSQDG
jgi:hypothetical protein